MDNENTPTQQSTAFLVRGSVEMAGRINAFDWASSPLGPIGSWPQSLRTALSILLGSRFPMQLLWGPEYIHFYNDAYLPIAADKHPDALGRPGGQIWPEIWDVVVPMLDQVRSTGEATWSDDQQLVLQRRGALAEGYFTFSYSPIAGESGTIDGIFIAVTETTRRVIGARRLQAVRDLGAALSGVATEQEVFRNAAAVLAGCTADLPYMLVYIRHGDELRLASATQLQAGAPAAPELVSIGGKSAGPWPMTAALAATQPLAVATPADPFGPLPGGPWNDAPLQALLLPLRSPQIPEPIGVFVAGVSPRQHLDNDYREFLERIAVQLAGATSVARTHAAAETAVRIRDDFLSIAAHELKNPLTPIIGKLQLLERRFIRDNLDPRHIHSLQTVANDAQRLTGLVDSLLDLSRLRSGQLSIERAPVDVGALVRRIVDELQPTLASHVLALAAPEAAVMVLGDRLRLEQVVRNLLSNAVKYSPSGGAISVAVAGRGDQAALTVSDQGAGIAPESIPRLFERYYRDGAAIAGPVGGLGVGLYVVHEIVRLHGGNVDVASQIGEGSTFTILLPRVASEG